MHNGYVKAHYNISNIYSKRYILCGFDIPLNINVIHGGKQLNKPFIVNCLWHEMPKLPQNEYPLATTTINSSSKALSKALFKVNTMYMRLSYMRTIQRMKPHPLGLYSDQI